MAAGERGESGAGSVAGSSGGGCGGLSSLIGRSRVLRHARTLSAPRAYAPITRKGLGRALDYDQQSVHRTVIIMSMMMTTDTPIRLLRPVDPPLGLYFRPGRNDHTVLGQMLEAGHREVSGFVFDPCLEKRHRDLREATIEHQLEAILDPKSLELATAGGIARTGVASLPWSLGENLPHEPTRLAIAKHDFVERLAAHVLANGYSAVLAPTHYLDDSRDDLAARGSRSHLGATGST